jgi:hypothetical protein
MNAFTWRVEANGYEWRGHRDRGLEYLLLAPRKAPRSAAGLREYQPDPALFREFAGAEPTPAGLLRLADRYGGLLDPSGYSVGEDSALPGCYPNYVEDDAGHVEMVCHETLDLWQEELGPLTHAVRLWDTGEGAEQLLALVNGGLAGRVTPRFVQDPRNGKLELQTVPENLLGALWLQLAEAIGGGKQFRQCITCGGWFEVSGRSDRRVCSDACRSRAYRGRQERARQLAAEGKGFPAIATELGSSVKTVRKWVTGR